MPFVSRTRATLRSAEFGFLGVAVYTRANAAPLGRGQAPLAALARLQAGGRGLLLGAGAALADQLIGARHGGEW